jgi:hypothetical protein
MEPERSLPCSKEPFTVPYLEPDESSPYHSIIFLQVLFKYPSTELGNDNKNVLYVHKFFFVYKGCNFVCLLYICKTLSY